MRVAIVGSRTLKVEGLQYYLPKDVSEIVSGGACGVDASAKEYAFTNGIKYTEFCRITKNMENRHRLSETWTL